jgi:hypothetical protein
MGLSRYPDIPMDRQVLGSAVAALIFASVMSWYKVYYHPRYRERCLEKMRRRLERKIAMGKKPSRWDKLLEKLWCS